MSEYKEKDQKSGMVTGQSVVAQSKQRGRARGVAFEDNRTETATWRGMCPTSHSNVAGRPVLQAKGFKGGKQLKTEETLQKKENRTGLPDDLKAGVENLSGMAMDDVRVSYNSDKPAQLNAHAYTQGAEIHVAPGQEKHLPHEAWHVVQQKEGSVRPTVQMKNGVLVNDDAGLEKEATVMGGRASQKDYREGSSILKKTTKDNKKSIMINPRQDSAPAQLMKCNRSPPSFHTKKRLDKTRGSR